MCGRNSSPLVGLGSIQSPAAEAGWSLRHVGGSVLVGGQEILW